MKKERKVTFKQRARGGVDYVVGQVQKAEAILAGTNIPLVKFLLGSRATREVESRLIGTGYDFADMLSDGLFALFKTVRRYPPGAEHRLTTWIKKTVFGDLNHLVEKAHAGTRPPASQRVQDRLEGNEMDIPNRAIEELHLERREKVRGPLDYVMEKEACEQGSDLLRAVESLPERERFALKSKYGLGVEELSYGEIAESLGVCRETAKNIFYAARKRLKETLVCL
ncbi:MAG: sigma-70 family RNA polymerase sigma factor [Nanoarchaeota archaeon]|nr:sigma-70 family RNA polymerase sigma factor [Nanoarchaeota archaeon]MBU1051128.1 sigma-70 family RNA polymerase sigma factor [Nanoarchaeota archaeon]MBU1988745.1 sigma-70 family RNA polymerase sigma factor [Nanoarchaeota archaeon]